MHTRQMPQHKKISTAFVSNIRIVKFRTQNTINQNDRNQQTKLANNRIFCLINSEVRVLYFNVFQTSQLGTLTK